MDRLGALRKFDLAHELIQLCADAIRLQHPKGKRLGDLRATDVMTWPDERIVKAVEQMRAWIEEHQTQPAGQG